MKTLALGIALMAAIGFVGCSDSGTSAGASGETLYLVPHDDGNTFSASFGDGLFTNP